MMITGLYHGMKARQLFPEGLILLSIPFDLLPGIVNNLQQMEWKLPQFTTGKEAHIKIMKKIAQDWRRNKAIILYYENNGNYLFTSQR